MIFQSIFANWLIFCQGGGPCCFVKYSPVLQWQCRGQLHHGHDSLRYEESQAEATVLAVLHDLSSIHLLHITGQTGWAGPDFTNQVSAFNIKHLVVKSQQMKDLTQDRISAATKF